MLPRLVFITDTGSFGDELTLEIATTLCSGAEPGSVAIQLREPQQSPSALLAFGRKLRGITRTHRQLLWVNDRLDLAVLVEADGVHLGERSVLPEVVRAQAARYVCARFVSRAWHSPSELPVTGAHAYLLSPVLAPRKGAAPIGLDGLRAALTVAPEAPVYALGGVGAATAAACLSVGAIGVAVIGAAYREPLALLRSLGIARTH